MASKIDIFNHVMPQAYLELVKAHSKEPGMVKRMSSLRMLWDIEHRVEMLRSRFPDVQQVLTLGLPSPELLGGPELSPRFARVANDSIAAMGRHHPHLFPSLFASFPLNKRPPPLEEMDPPPRQLRAPRPPILSHVPRRPP